MFWSSGTTDSGDAANGTNGFGFHAGPATNNGSHVYGNIANNVSTTNVTTQGAVGWPVRILTPGGGGYIAEGVFVSWNATGFTLNWTSGIQASTNIHYLALGGTECSAIARNFTPRTTVGTQPITGVGFQPKLLIFCYSTNLGTTRGYGAATSATSRWACSQSGVSGATMASTNLASRIQHQSACIALLNNGGATTLLARADLVSMDTDGFTLNWTTATATQINISYLAFGGSGQFATGTFTKAANTSATSETINAGFRPSAYMLFANGTTNETGQSTGWRSSIGGSDGTTAGVACWESKNAVLPTQARRLSATSGDISHVRALPASISAAGSVEAAHRHTAFTDTGVTLNYNVNAVTTQYIFPWIAFGGAPISMPNTALAGPADNFN